MEKGKKRRKVLEDKVREGMCWRMEKGKKGRRGLRMEKGKKRRKVLEDGERKETAMGEENKPQRRQKW